MQKKVVFGDKNLDMCLSHEIESFDLKKKYQICFLRTKKKRKKIFDNKKIRSIVTMF